MGRRNRRRTDDHQPSQPPAPPDPRGRPLARLAQQVCELADHYAEGHATGPGLLAQLHDPEMHTQAVLRAETRPAGRPGAAEPARIGMLDLAAAICDWAEYYAHQAGWNGVGPVRALRLLPDLYADADPGDIRAVVRHLGRLISTARTCLGYQQASEHYPDVVCPCCQQASVRGRSEQLRAWCGNDECPGDPDTGDRYEFRNVIALQAAIRRDAAAREGAA